MKCSRLNSELQSISILFSVEIFGLKMNSELLREREAFKKRAMATAAVSAPSKRPKESSGPSSAPASENRKSSKSGDQSAKAKLDLAQMKSMGQSGSQFKFGVLAKIVRHMKARHMEGEDQPLTMEDILDETNQVWLTSIMILSFFVNLEMEDVRCQIWKRGFGVVSPIRFEARIPIR